LHRIDPALDLPRQIIDRDLGNGVSIASSFTGSA
jgi:hypothetical protein